MEIFILKKNKKYFFNICNNFLVFLDLHENMEKTTKKQKQ